MEQIVIPQTAEEMKARLGGIERLLTARGWERAAIVYAFTEVRNPGHTSRNQSAKTGRFSFVEFAAFGIHGLRSAMTVRECHDAWQQAIEQGQAEPVGPGDAALLPDIGYPPTPRPSKTSMLATDAPVSDKIEAVTRVTEADPDFKSALTAHVLAQPDVQETIRQQAPNIVGQSPDLMIKASNVYDEFHVAPTPTDRPDTSFLDTQVMFELGSRIYTMIQVAARKDLNRILDHLKSYPPDSHEPTAIRLEQLKSDLEKARGLIADIERALDQGAGVDYDALFERLVKGN